MNLPISATSSPMWTSTSALIANWLVLWFFLRGFSHSFYLLHNYSLRSGLFQVLGRRFFGGLAKDEQG